MTALNLLCQGDTAFMLTDAAVTDLNGLLLSTRPKALLLKRARMAICWTGFAPMPAGGAQAATNSRAALESGPACTRPRTRPSRSERCYGGSAGSTSNDAHRKHNLDARCHAGND